MTTSETVLVIIGGCSSPARSWPWPSDGRRNWIACSFSFRVTTPDARYLRGPKVKQEPVPQAAPEPAKDARIVSLGEAS